MDIELLRTFHAVATLGRFKDAARQLHRSSSAVSVHIQRLEQETGGRLFARNNASVELTEHGRFVLAETGPLLREHQRVLGALAQAPVSAKIRIGIPEEYAAALVAGMLPRFTLRHPRIALSLRVGSSGQLAHDFDRGHLDAAVTVETECRPDHRLAELRPVWAARTDAPILAERPLPVAIHGEGCVYRALAETALSDAGLDWRPVIRSESSAAIHAAIGAGLCIGIMDGADLGPGLAALPREAGLPGLRVLHVAYRSRIAGPARAILQAAIGDHFRPRGG